MKFIRHRNSKMTLKTEHELKPFLNFIDNTMILQQQQNLGRRFGTSKMHLSPPVA